MILHLGVIDVPEPSGSTTYEVGSELEKDYGLFTQFYEFYEDTIAQALEKDVQKAIDNLTSQRPVALTFNTATSAIDTMFNHFLDASVIETLGVNGVPTKAALEGKTTRFKRGLTAKSWVKGKRGEIKKRFGPRRPSFIDSGVLKASFKSWVD